MNMSPKIKKNDDVNAIDDVIVLRKDFHSQGCSFELKSFLSNCRIT